MCVCEVCICMCVCICVRYVCMYVCVYVCICACEVCVCLSMWGMYVHECVCDVCEAFMCVCICTCILCIYVCEVCMCMGVYVRYVRVCEVCVHMYVCECVYMCMWHICLCMISVYKCVWLVCVKCVCVLCIYVLRYVCVCVYVYVRYVFVWGVCACVHVCVDIACMCVCMYMCLWSIYVCVWSACVCVCVCMCMKHNCFSWPAAPETPLQRRLFWGRRASAAHRGGGITTETVLFTCWPGPSSRETTAHLETPAPPPPTPVVDSSAVTGSQMWSRCLLEQHLLSVWTLLHCLFCSTRFLCLCHLSWPRDTVSCLLNLFVQIPTDRVREGTTHSQQPTSGVVGESASFFSVSLHSCPQPGHPLY